MSAILADSLSSLYDEVEETILSVMASGTPASFITITAPELKHEGTKYWLEMKVGIVPPPTG